MKTVEVCHFRSILNRLSGPGTLSLGWLKIFYSSPGNWSGLHMVMESGNVGSGHGSYSPDIKYIHHSSCFLTASPQQNILYPLNIWGKISVYTPLYLFSGSSHFSNSPRGFEEFEKWQVPLFGWSDHSLLLCDLRQETTQLLNGNKRKFSCSSQLRSCQGKCLNISWSPIGQIYPAVHFLSK